MPGGVGVFEGLMILLLRPWLPAPALVPAFVVYRAVYYLLPFAVGLPIGADPAEPGRRTASPVWCEKRSLTSLK